MSRSKWSRSTRFGRVIGTLLLVSGIGLTTVATAATAAPAPTSLASSVPAVSGFDPNTKAEDLPIAVGWGKNADGELGAGNFQKSTVPVVADGNDVLTGKVVTDIDSGPFNTCAVADGAVYCWGGNQFGQLGNGGNAASPVPVKVNGLLLGKQATAVTVGRYHVCAIASNKAYCWGYNQHGELGNASDVISKVPVAVHMGGVLARLSVTGISAGNTHTCAIANARAFCWGSADVGQLGNDAIGGWFTIPVEVDTTGSLHNKPVAAIAAGARHTCALALGQAFCWGLGDVGQLGNGDVSSHSKPVGVVFILAR